MVNSAARSRSNSAAPRSQKISKASLFGCPYAIRDTEKVPTAPPAKVAVKVATSSFSTGSRVSLTATPPAWPTARPSGTGRSLTTVAKTVPATLRIGPQKNSPRSTRWLPMSASAPVPGPPR